MGQRTKQTFLQRRHTDGQQTHEKMLNITHYPEKCKSKPQCGTISHQAEWLLSKSIQTINASEGVEKKEPSYTVGGNAN